MFKYYNYFFFYIMNTKDLYEEVPTYMKTQIEAEFKRFKKMFPNLPDEQIRSMAISAAGGAGRLSQILYPERHQPVKF